MSNIIRGDSSTTTEPAVEGIATIGTGVHGRSEAKDGSKGQAGVVGEFENGVGVFGRSSSSSGVGGMSTTGIGVNGVSDNVGVQGNSAKGRGVAGYSDSWQGVYGFSKTQAGVVGESNDFDGVFGISHNGKAAAVSGHNAGGMAGYFEGDLVVTGDIKISGADCAEDFDVLDRSEAAPGTVMILDGSGALRVSEQEYDTRVAGVVSGAGTYRPAMIMDHASDVGRVAVALMGKVFCKVDASLGPISPGDLLTTSAVPGCAMRVDDRARAFGAVIGKALAPCDRRGVIPILVTLQ